MNLHSLLCWGSLLVDIARARKWLAWCCNIPWLDRSGWVALGRAVTSLVGRVTGLGLDTDRNGKKQHCILHFGEKMCLSSSMSISTWSVERPADKVKSRGFEFQQGDAGGGGRLTSLCLYSAKLRNCENLKSYKIHILT